MSTGQPPRLYVTQPELPPLEDFLPSLREIWDSRWLTNGGPFHERLEHALAEHLGVPQVALFANGTVALITALRALQLSGEVITTPYSFIATAHSLRWNGLEPVFVDIDPVTLNMDPARIEAAITPRTTAIMPVHCYGRPCDVDAIEAIAARHGLKVIYDAAHAFGVRCHCGSVLTHGDLSVLSFHATKVFNTFEGGAVICRDAAMKRRLDLLKNFGIADEVTVEDVGINGKMSEFNAALGLLQLKGVDEALRRRAEIAAHYREALAGLPGLRCLAELPGHGVNNAYFPVLITGEGHMGRDALHEHLRAHGVVARRYFYPLISAFPMYRTLPSAAPDHLPVAEAAARQILCLPIYPQLTDADQARVVGLIAGALRG